MINQYSYEILKDIYNKCTEKQDNSNLPVILYLMKKSVNDRVQILKETAVDATYVDNETKNEMLTSGMLVEVKNTSKLAITAKGLWEVMNKEMDDATDVLISAIQNSYFDEFKSMSITPRNRITLFAMISMRTFSKECCVNIKTTEISNQWWAIFLKVNDFLIKMNVVSPTYSLHKEGDYINDSETNTAKLVRHTDKLPRITNNIMSKSGKLDYWLDIANKNHEIDIQKLSFLIKQVLGNSLTNENCAEYWKFANGLCMNEGHHFELSFNDTTFLDCDYDSTIRRAFEKACMIVIN